MPEVVPDVEECKEEGAKNDMQVKQSIVFGDTTFLQMVSQPWTLQNQNVSRKHFFGKTRLFWRSEYFRSAQATHAGEKYWKCRIMYDCVTWASLHDMLLKGW